MKNVDTSPLPVVPFSADVDRLLFDLNSAFNPLHSGCQVDFHVSAVRDGYVHLSVALPEGMTRAYVTLLESLGGLFRCIDTKSRSASAQSKVYDTSQREAVTERAAAFSQKVGALSVTALLPMAVILLRQPNVLIALSKLNLTHGRPMR